MILLIDILNNHIQILVGQYHVDLLFLSFDELIELEKHVQIGHLYFHQQLLIQCILLYQVMDQLSVRVDGILVDIVLYLFQKD